MVVTETVQLIYFKCVLCKQIYVDVNTADVMYMLGVRVRESVALEEPLKYIP